MRRANFTTVGVILLLILGVLAPFFAYPVYVMQMLCFALLATAFNLLLGYAGLLSFGHAAFFGGAAYVSGYVIRLLGGAPLLGVLIGTVFGALLGFLFALLATRRRGIYFAMITLALAQIVYFSANQLEFTGGEDGLRGIPRGSLFGIIDLNEMRSIYYFVFAITVGGIWMIYRVVNSPFGKVLAAIKENENRMISLGYDVARSKIIVFSISAAFAGMAGSTKALVLQFASLADVHWMMSGEIILMALVGGVNVFLGPAFGAAFIVSLQQKLSGAGSWIEVIVGLIFVVCVMAFRRGLFGEFVLRVRDALSTKRRTDIGGNVVPGEPRV